jgi:2-phospho-L-lactate guanylyltransferase
MALWCLIPIKPFSSGKSRLAEYLTVDQRILLNRNLAENTIHTCKSVKYIEQVLIVSSGREMHRFAIKCGVEFVEEPVGGINAALDLASEYAQAHGADSLLVIHSDLPSIRAAEIENLIHRSLKQKGVCIVPDHHHTGTNALLLRPPRSIPFLFGEGSYSRHINAARDKDIPVSTLLLPSISFDLDTVEDLEYALHREFLSRELAAQIKNRS